LIEAIEQEKQSPGQRPSSHISEVASSIFQSLSKQTPSSISSVSSWSSFSFRPLSRNCKIHTEND